MPLATYIYSGNVFRFMKLEQSMAGEDSEPEKTSSELAGTHFTIGKKKSDENSGVQKVQNRNNCGIPRNSERISQSSAAREMNYCDRFSIVGYTSCKLHNDKREEIFRCTKYSGDGQWYDWCLVEWVD
jgi:hypothetical protein